MFDIFCTNVHFDSSTVICLCGCL